MKISIITASFNRVDMIQKCLQSISTQSFRNIEHIVIDGGSSDGTLEFLRQSIDRIHFLLSEPDKGIYDALNKGIKMATGDIIGLLHSDDIYADENVISEVNSFFELNPTIDIVIGNVSYFNQINKGSPTRQYNSNIFKPWMLRFGFIPAHTATFIRREVFSRYGFYRTDLMGAGDFEFFVRLFMVHSVSLAFLGRTLVHMRNGGVSNIGLKSQLRNSQEIFYSLKINEVYSNWVFILLRLPIKVIWITFYRLRMFLFRGNIFGD